MRLTASRNASAALAAPSSGPVVAYTKRTEPASLIMMRASSAALGVVGALKDISDGKKISKLHQLEEPANEVARAIAQAYAESIGGQVAQAPIAVGPGKTDLAAAHDGKAQFIVDAMPAGSTVQYFSFDWAHYTVFFLTQVRILDVASNTVLKSGKCAVKPPKDDPPTYDQLMADEAAGLRKLLSQGAQACVEDLLAKDLKF